MSNICSYSRHYEKSEVKDQVNREHEALIRIIELLDSYEAEESNDCVWCENLIRKIREVISEPS